MKCPNCQTENTETAKFCTSCGKPLQAEITCTQCHHINNASAKFCEECGHPLAEATPPPTDKPTEIPSQPTSFANGRYQVRKFLGEGGKKKVYLAHDVTLDRDVAFALIKTENLDSSARARIIREAQAMGRLGDHPNIGNVYDIGDHEGQPYIVQSCITGGDVEGLIRNAPDHKLPMDRVIDIARAVCRGLEFAHARNIIHRDIKPGNVMLTEDGTARIVDFGLAVAMDMSRLTRSGMMVGTVSYMPPEQAMGGQVTAKADLYSLGAMLYEMVTGRPPFVGDDSISIIGQHINTPPVSPSWHRADLPPALETLILQLLEKDPSKRPESAAVVRQALESITAGKAEETSVEASLSVENPLYRRVFVGRESELKQLQSAFDGAISGKGSLMMVVGEPGIGKTALCEQLSTYVTLRGGRTLLGHCYEEGSLSLPYLAFVESLRSYVMTRPVKELREELGTEAGDVARIVSEIRDKLRIKPKPKTDPEEERYRLMQGVTNFLANAASVQPMMIVLEDLHDADKGTLDMLTHVSRNLGGTRLLIVGTYRDVEVDRSHPLSSALAELRRLSTYSRVLLRGLNPDEVRRMLESITRENVPWNLSEAVHRQTEGNPLFVQEVVRFLVEEGLLREKDGHWQTSKETPLEMNIPEGLRDVIGKRLSLLSPECNHLLSAAAVIGREFDLEILKAVTESNDETFVNALNEAVQLSILEERSRVGQIKYRFTHAFFRQTLYEELIAPRRLRLHQQVARAIENHYTNRLEEHAAELAEHFSQSTDPADLEKAVKYGEMAAKRAEEVYAYGEAVRLLDQAINVQRVLNPDDKEKLCDLLLDLCEILVYVPEPRRILDTEALAAVSLADDIGYAAKAFRVCWAACSAIIMEQANWSTPEYIGWVNRMDRYARPDTTERARADMVQGAMQMNSGNAKEGRKLLTRALELARRLNDRETYTYAVNYLLTFSTAPQHAQESLRLAEEYWENSRTWSKNYNLVGSWNNIGNSFLAMGQRRRAEEVLKELVPFAERAGGLYSIQWKNIAAIFTALLDGRLEEVVTLVDKMQGEGEEAGIGGLTSIFQFIYGLKPRIYLGKPLDTIEERVRGDKLGYAVLCLILAHTARNEEATEILDENVVKRPYIGTNEDETRGSYDVLLLEASNLIGHRKAAELLMNRFIGTGLCTSGTYYTTSIPRHLGGAAALLGKYDEARKHYQEAIRVCTEMPFRPELALSKLQLAELLLEHYPDEKKEALEHLDFAIKEFREMKMQPSLERALRHKDILKA